MYIQETFPEHIKYVQDTPENRERLGEKLGPEKIYSKDITYLEVDLNKKSWRVCFAYEWLYRNPPPLTSINNLQL